MSEQIIDINATADAGCASGEYVRPEKLPLWKAAYEDLEKAGLSYNQVIEATFFEDRLKAKRDTLEFGMGVSAIREALEFDGYYLNGRGLKGEQYILQPAANNAATMKCYSEQAAKLFRRAAVLGAATNLDGLTETQRRRHESTLERIQLKRALLARSGQIATAIRKHAPKLLGK